MPTLESSIFMEIDAEKKKKNPEEELKRKKRQTLIFIAHNPTPIFTTQYSAEKQAVCELAFAEETVENPEMRKEKLKGYIC